MRNVDLSWLAETVLSRCAAKKSILNLLGHFLLSRLADTFLYLNSVCDAWEGVGVDEYHEDEIQAARHTSGERVT